MAFMLKKKRYKFHVDLCLEEQSEVAYGKAILFAKVRQLDGGSFTDVSKRMEVQNHRVKYMARFQFPCKMNAAASSGILDTSKCRISIRMEEKGGRNFRKLGFTDINLAEYAGAGPSTQRYILQPYDQNHRLDNSILQVSLNITLKEGDTIFQRPLTRQQPIHLPPGEDHLAREGSSTPTAELGLPESSSVTSALTVPSSDAMRASAVSINAVQDPAPVTAQAIATTSALTADKAAPKGLGLPASVEDPSHTRNSSTTSQASAGYASSQGHSRQSSSGGDTNGAHGRNLSQGSSDTGFFGSMEKEKRRKQKLDEGRIDAEQIINELIEGVDLNQACTQEDAESSGLQLFVGKDGSVTFDKNSTTLKDFKPVIIKGPR